LLAYALTRAFFISLACDRNAAVASVSWRARTGQDFAIRPLPAAAKVQLSSSETLIADVTLQSGGIVVVTGKGYGATYFIAMDRSGDVLVDRQIQVEGPTERLVTVYRGVERESYSCAPICQRRITLGDGETISRPRSTRPVRSPARPGCGAAGAKSSN
jgi:hypothetical protein